MSGNHVVILPGSTRPFDPKASRYMCCCSCMHVTTGVYVFGAIELVAAGTVAATAFWRELNNSAGKRGQIYENTALLSVFLLTVVLMWMGIKLKRPSFVIPHLVTEVAAMIYRVIIITMVIIAVKNGGSIMQYAMEESAINRDKPSDAEAAVRILLIGLIIVFCLGFIFHLWFFFLTYRCYRYLKDRGIVERVLFANIVETRPLQSHPREAQPFDDRPPPYPGTPEPKEGKLKRQL